MAGLAFDFSKNVLFRAAIMRRKILPVPWGVHPIPDLRRTGASGVRRGNEA